MILTSQDIRLILSEIHVGLGYSDDPDICALQMKLSIMLQMAEEQEGQP